MTVIQMDDNMTGLWPHFPLQLFKYHFPQNDVEILMREWQGGKIEDANS